MFELQFIPCRIHGSCFICFYVLKRSQGFWPGERDFFEVIAVGAHFPHPTFSPELNVQLGTTRHDARVYVNPQNMKIGKGAGQFLY